ncbi:MAG: MBL fold metallo-hydrolase [Treponema sp.]|jgi:glyoxylase-like metal-dependent hydrolase (beta-lactamase superfamily II)|nr:MBL fold metallo-hydrolase [Treponema sp.]
MQINHITVGDIATNCWLYPLNETECAVIDPGAEPEKIIARLKQLHLRLAYILLTHGHFDHIAALPQLAAAFAPVIAIHRLDAQYLGPASNAVHRHSFTIAAGNADYIDALWEDMPAADRELEEGDKIGPFTVLHIPGHTEGSVGFYDEAAKVLFSGDTLFRGDYGRTDLPGGSDEKIFASLKRLLAMDGDIQVFPGHGPATTIKEEAARGMIR